MGDIDSSVKSNIPILRPTGRPFASKWTIQNDSGRYFEPAVRRYRRVKVQTSEQQSLLDWILPRLTFQSNLISILPMIGTKLAKTEGTT